MAKAKTAIIFTIWLICMIGLWLIFFLTERGDMLTSLFGPSWAIASGIAALLLTVLPIMLRLRARLSLKKVILCMLLCFIAFSFALALTHFGAKAYFQSFSTEKWEQHPDQRERMIESLSTSHALIGMNGNDIIKLLGDADKTQGRTALYRISKDEDVYFAIKYNGSNLVTHTEITLDASDMPLSVN